MYLQQEQADTRSTSTSRRKVEQIHIEKIIAWGKKSLHKINEDWEGEYEI